MLNWVLCLGITSSKLRAWLDGFLSRDIQEESDSKFIQGVGRIQLLLTVGLRSPAPCWKSPQLLSAPRGHHHSFRCSPLHLNSSTVHQILVMFQISLTSSAFLSCHRESFLLLQEYVIRLNKIG